MIPEKTDSEIEIEVEKAGGVGGVGSSAGEVRRTETGSGDSDSVADSSPTGVEEGDWHTFDQSTPSMGFEEGAGGNLPERVGRFLILGLLGQGGGGRVYLAEDPVLKRRVAIKTPHLALVAQDERAVRRLFREARTASRLKHPNIVTLHEFGTSEGICHIVLEYVEGRTLGELLWERAGKGEGWRPTAADDARSARWIRDLALALEYAHGEGAIHRDIKPHNIMIDAHGRAMLMDFGLARIEGDQPMTVEGTICGTPGYLSPEAASGKVGEIDGRSDVYGLGVVLYELLTNRRAFTGPVDTVIHRVIRDDPEPPRRIRRDVSRDLEAICLKAMEKRPERRYAGGKALADDLERWLEGLPVTARPMTTARRLWRRARRNPAIASLTGLALALLLGGLAGISMALVRAERMRERAEAESRTSRMRYFNARMNLLQMAWNGNQLERFDALLRETGTEADAEDLDEFEWRHWSAMRKSGHVFGGGPAGQVIHAMAHTSDGAALVTAGRSGRIEFREAETGAILSRLNNGAAVNDLFLDDERGLLHTFDARGDWTVWDAREGRELVRRRIHEQSILSAARDGEGRRVATTSRDGTLRIHEIASGERINTVGPRHEGSPRFRVAYHPRANLMATGDRSGMVEIRDGDGHPLGEFRAHAEFVSALAFNGDGSLLATGGADRVVFVWETNPFREPKLRLKGHSEEPWNLSFAPDSRTLASSGLDGLLFVWDLEPDDEESGGRPLSRYQGHSLDILAMARDPARGSILTAGRDDAIRIWNLDAPQGRMRLNGGREPREAMRDGRSSIRTLALDPGGRYLCAGGDGGEIEVWDLTTGKLARRIATRESAVRGEEEGWIAAAVAFRTVGGGEGSPRLVAAGRDGVLRCWNPETGERIWRDAPKSGAAKALAVGGLEGGFVAGLADGTIEARDASGKVTRRWKGPWTGLEAVAADAGGAFSAIADDSGAVYAIDRESGEVAADLGRPEGGRSGRFTRVAFSADGRMLAAGGTHNEARIWRTSDWVVLQNLAGHDDPITDLAFAPGGRRLATASLDDRVKLWDVRTGQETLTLDDFRHDAHAALFDATGERLIAGGRDGAVRIWLAPRE